MLSSCILILYGSYFREGCNVLIFPGAFNLTTGEAHWELLQRGRAIDNEVYVATCSPARDMQATYNAWGHSMVSLCGVTAKIFSVLS